jgi:hypothetical protein
VSVAVLAVLLAHFGRKRLLLRRPVRLLLLLALQLWVLILFNFPFPRLLRHRIPVCQRQQLDPELLASHTLCPQRRTIRLRAEENN